MIETYTKNNGEKLFNETDFIAQGGEAAIYGWNNLAYKIYHDPKNVIPEQKTKELSLLNKPNIICPIETVFKNNRLKEHIGITMQWVKNTIPFPTMFSNGFWKEKNFTPERAIKLIEKQIETTEFIHSKDCLIVDLNEMAFLVNDNRFDDVYFIDVTSYQTKNYPASAIAPGIRDYQSKQFSVLTDWYSMAIVSCYFLIGNHPFRINHPNHSGKDINGMVERMKANVSIFNSKARYNKAVRDFGVIPDNYRKWMVELFENGKRIPPPGNAGLINIVPVKVKVTMGDLFEVKLLQTYQEEILSHKYINGYRIAKTASGYQVGNKQLSNSGEPVFISGDVIINASIKNGFLVFNLNKANYTINGLNVKARKTLTVDNKLFSIYDDKITCIEFTEFGKRIVPSIGKQWKILPNATRIFKNVMITDAFGLPIFTLPVINDKNEGTCTILEIKELFRYRFINAKRSKNVMMLIAEKSNEYHRIVVWFDHNKNYQIEITENISLLELNFVVNDKGIGCMIDENDEVVLFSGAGKQKRFKDRNINQLMQLSSEGNDIVFYVDSSLYRMKLK